MSLYMSFQNYFLKGRQYLVSGGKNIIIRAACITDIEQIISLLNSIQITPDNLNIKLSDTHQDSFKKRGGFFVIWNAAQLAGFLEDPKNLILVAVTKGDKKEVINGFLWCRLNLDTITVSDWQLESSLVEKHHLARFNRALEENLVFTAVECAVEPSYHGNGISYCIIHEMYNWLWTKGYLFAVLQIYTIYGEYEDEYLIRRNLPNEASIKHIKKYGAVRIKEGFLADQTIGRRRFKVNSDVYLLDLEHAVPRLKALSSKYLEKCQLS